MVKRAASSFNGITIAYVMGFVNAVLGAIVAFGGHLSDQQDASLTALVNAGLILAIHVSHRVGEVSPTPLPPATPNTPTEAPPEAQTATST